MMQWALLATGHPEWHNPVCITALTDHSFLVSPGVCLCLCKKKRPSIMQAPEHVPMLGFASGSAGKTALSYTPGCHHSCPVLASPWLLSRVRVACCFLKDKSVLGQLLLLAFHCWDVLFKACQVVPPWSCRYCAILTSSCHQWFHMCYNRLGSTFMRCELLLSVSLSAAFSPLCVCHSLWAGFLNFVNLAKVR